jgi:Spy/CpxP family protein refolding chaperone
MHHGGPLGLLKAALRELDLSAEQKAAVEGALAKLPAPPHERGEDPGKEARAALARSVREGKVDPGAIPAAPRPDFEAMQASAAEALQTLHKTLTPQQRRALVDTLQKRAEEHGPWGRGRRGPDGEGPREHGKHGPRGAGPEGLGPAGFFLRDLGLTELQKTSIQKALKESMADLAGDKERPDPAVLEKKREEMRAGMKARLESFASDSFDARAFVAPPKDAKAHPGLKDHGERMHRMLSVVVPLLDSAQREKLAQRIESGPAFPPPGHHGPDAPEGE